MTNEELIKDEMYYRPNSILLLRFIELIDNLEFLEEEQDQEIRTLNPLVDSLEDDIFELNGENEVLTIYLSKLQKLIEKAYDELRLQDSGILL